jgi:hypothetical protein
MMLLGCLPLTVSHGMAGVPNRLPQTLRRTASQTRRTQRGAKCYICHISEARCRWPPPIESFQSSEGAEAFVKSFKRELLMPPKDMFDVLRLADHVNTGVIRARFIRLPNRRWVSDTRGKKSFWPSRTEKPLSIWRARLFEAQLANMAISV